MLCWETGVEISCVSVPWSLSTLCHTAEQRRRCGKWQIHSQSSANAHFIIQPLLLHERPASICPCAMRIVHTLNSIKWQFSCWTAWTQVLYWLLINFESAATRLPVRNVWAIVLWLLPWMRVQMNCVIWFIFDNCVWYGRSSTRYWL